MHIGAQSRINFGIYLLNDTSFGHETWTTNTYSYGEFFREILHNLEDSVLNPGLFSIYQPTTINQKPITSLFILLFWRCALR